MSADADNACTLPDKHRQPEPVPEPTVAKMKLGDSAYVQFSAIRIDRKWRVWIDPTARVRWPDSGIQPEKTVAVDLQLTGFVINLLYALNRDKKLWKAEPAVDFFAGFFPVVQVN